MQLITPHCDNNKLMMHFYQLDRTAHVLLTAIYCQKHVKSLKNDIRQKLTKWSSAMGHLPKNGDHVTSALYGPPCDKTCLLGFRQIETRTILLSCIAGKLKFVAK